MTETGTDEVVFDMRTLDNYNASRLNGARYRHALDDDGVVSFVDSEPIKSRVSGSFNDFRDDGVAPAVREMGYDGLIEMRFGVESQHIKGGRDDRWIILGRPIVRVK